MGSGVGSGSEVLGVGSVFVIGVGLLLLGLVLMLIMRAAARRSSAASTLRQESPALELPE